MRLSVHVIPRSGKNALEWVPGEPATLKARLTAAPVDGAANAALVALLAERLKVPRRAVTIVRGATSRQKIIDIADITEAEVQQRLNGKH